MEDKLHWRHDKTLTFTVPAKSFRVHLVSIMAADGVALASSVLYMLMGWGK